ncbi:TraX family protein [Bifidobacterium callitrichos]|nr:TraX family protein [Bifidobacterium callitrichos]
MTMNQPNRSRASRGLTSFRLKVIGAVFMALSIASTTLMPAILGVSLDAGAGMASISSADMVSLTEIVLCEIISWCAVPIYAWLLVDGYRHTRGVWAYVGRLAALAVVCEVPYDLATSGKAFDMSSQNPVWGLVIALIVLALLDWTVARFGRAAARVLISLAIVLAGIMWNLLMNVGLRQHVMYAGALTLGFALIFRYLAARENTMMITAGLLGAMMLIVPAVGVMFLHWRNGEAGYARPWTKWVFYALYPVMLLAGCVFTVL